MTSEVFKDRLQEVIEAQWPSPPRAAFEAVAKGLWYGPAHYLTDAERLFTELLASGQLLQAKKLGYLVEVLQSFDCLSQASWGTMQALLTQWRSDLDIACDAPIAVANSWGLASDIDEAIQWVLPFQTRHYAMTVQDHPAQFFERNA